MFVGGGVSSLIVSQHHTLLQVVQNIFMYLVYSALMIAPSLNNAVYRILSFSLDSP